MKNWHRMMVVGCLGVGLAGVACGTERSHSDEVRVTPSTTAGEVAIRAATPADIAHACMHAVDPGSFQNETAVTTGDGPAVVDHVAYNLTLPGAGPYSGYVDLETEDADPVDGGTPTLEYAIYTDPSVTSVSIAPASGGPAVPLEWSVALDGDDCAAPAADSGIPTYGTVDRGLSYVRTYLLQPETKYRITITHLSNPVLAIFENLDE